MSAPKHTPGPWHCTSERDSVTGQVSTQPVGYRSYGDIATTFGDDAKANACLIAAAPELLEALRLMDEVYCADDYGTREGRAKGRAALIATRAAIAKATGGAA